MTLQPTENKTTVILPIRKEEHVDFLRSIFNGTRGQPIKINRDEFLGKFIFSLRRYSDRPSCQSIPEGSIPVEVQFPASALSTADRHFCYFTLEDVERINDFISSVFDLYFHVYFLDTRDISRLQEEDEFSNMEITREMLVDSFVFGLDMVDFSRANETLKKREYRAQMKEIARTRQKFLKKDYNFRRKIYQRRRIYLKNMILGS